ncbi:MAG: hypothetical protein ACR2L2_02735 [Acidobacteriota bacterium]
MPYAVCRMPQAGEPCATSALRVKSCHFVTIFDHPFDQPARSLTVAALLPLRR